MGIFSSLLSLGKRNVSGVNVTDYKMYGPMDGMYIWDGVNSTSVYINAIYNRISSDASDLNLQYVRDDNIDGVSSRVNLSNSMLNYVLTVSPNSYSSPSNFWKQVINRMLQRGICVVLPVYKDGSVVELQIVDDYEFDIKNNRVYIASQAYILDNVLIFEDSNYGLHNSANNISKLINDSLNAMSMQLAANKRPLHGFLKLGTSAKDAEMKARADSRVKNIMNVASSSGIGYLDKDEEFVELKTNIETVPYEQLNFLKNQLYENYGIDNKLLTSNYSQEQYLAYLKSVIYPIQKAIVEELNRKLISRNSMGLGYKIISAKNVLNNVSPNEIASTLQSLKYIGVISANEARRALGYASYEGGDLYESNYNARPVAAPNDSIDGEKNESIKN